MIHENLEEIYAKKIQKQNQEELRNLPSYPCDFSRELDGSAFKYIKISFMLALCTQPYGFACQHLRCLVTSRQRRVITTFYFSIFRGRDIFYFRQRRAGNPRSKSGYEREARVIKIFS